MKANNMTATLISRPILLAATAISASCAISGTALADDTDRLIAIEKQIQALKAELRHVKQEAASRDRELEAARRSAANPAYSPPPPAPIAAAMPQIPAGYALVPASSGSTPGSVVLARAEPPPPPPPQGTFRIGNVNIQLGGFLAAESVYRSRNEVADIGSSLSSGIPEKNSVLYHEPEFRESARQSRLTANVTANPDDVTRLRAYVSIDFNGAAPTSNSTESNSFVPRLREGYTSYLRSDLGFEVMAGQTWSLLTPTRIAMSPLNVTPPQTIDPQYVPGFFWARQPGFRLEKSFKDGQYWLALAAENPQTVYTSTSIPSALGTLNVTNPGTANLANGSNAGTTVVTGETAVTTTTTKNGKTTSKTVLTPTTANVASLGSFSNDIAPDMIVKASADYKLAHLEAFGLGRVFHDRLSQLGTGQSNTMFGGGGGASALIHLIPDVLDIQFDGMAGQGIGRYGTSQLPDATIDDKGEPKALPEWMAMAGIIDHPIPQMDVYGYIGTEQTTARYFTETVNGKTTGYGYGNPLYNNSGCQTELDPASTCVANTSGVVGGAVGAWYRFLKGPYGTLQAGVQYTYVHRDVFQGVGPTPQTNENMVFLSFRYFPFQ